MKAHQLPSWPERSVYKANDFGRRAYRAEAYDAAMARLRICEAVLQDIRINAHTLEDAIGYATEALSAIGPLPLTNKENSPE